MGKNNNTIFSETILSGYSFEGKSIIIGGAMYERECLQNHFVRLPLATMNRHGLIAGATGTGKTKTLQIIAEQLSAYDSQLNHLGTIILPSGCF